MAVVDDAQLVNSVVKLAKEAKCIQTVCAAFFGALQRDTNLFEQLDPEAPKDTIVAAFAQAYNEWNNSRTAEQKANTEAVKELDLSRHVRIEDPGGLPTPCGPHVACPHCRRPLTLTASPPERADLKTNGEERMANVTVLYSNKTIHFMSVLVMGHSLKNFSQHERILLFTPDVPRGYIDILKHYWDCRSVAHVLAARNMFKPNCETSLKVFAKLHCLNLEEYKKILMLNCDLWIRGGTDYLFQFDAPAAMLRGANPPEEGAEYDSRSFWRRKDHYSYPSNSLQAGLLVLEPNKQVYERMMEEIVREHGTHTEACRSTFPDREYLGQFFTTFLTGKITHFDAKFNYQISLPEESQTSAYKDLTPSSIYVVQFDIRSKPWYLLPKELLSNDDTAIHAKFPIGSQENGGVSRETAAYLWEWINELRLVDKQVALNQPGCSLLAVIESVEGESKEMRKPEITGDDILELKNVLREWAIDERKQRWTLVINGSRTWIEFRPDGVLWSESGLGTWELQRNASDGTHEMKIQLNKESMVLTLVDANGEHKKKFEGENCSGWPFEFGSFQAGKGPSSGKDGKGYRSRGGRPQLNGSASAPAIKSSWPFFDYERSNSSAKGGGAYIKRGGCRAMKVGDEGMAIGVEVVNADSSKGKGGKGKGRDPNEAQPYSVGQINADNVFVPWRGDLTESQLEFLKKYSGESQYYAARAEPRDPGIVTRWLLCTMQHGSEYLVVRQGNKSGDGTPLKIKKGEPVRLAHEFAEVIRDAAAEAQT